MAVDDGGASAQMEVCRQVCCWEWSLDPLFIFPEKERCSKQKRRSKFCAERAPGFRKWNLVMSHSGLHPLLSFLCYFTDQHLAYIWLQVSDTSTAEQWKANTVRTHEAPTPSHICLSHWARSENCFTCHFPFGFLSSFRNSFTRHPD